MSLADEGGVSHGGDGEGEVCGWGEDGVRLLALFDGEPQHLHSPIQAGEQGLPSELQPLRREGEGDSITQGAKRQGFTYSDMSGQVLQSLIKAMVASFRQ